MAIAEKDSSMESEWGEGVEKLSHPEEENSEIGNEIKESNIHDVTDDLEFYMEKLKEESGLGEGRVPAFGKKEEEKEDLTVVDADEIRESNQPNEEEDKYGEQTSEERSLKGNLTGDSDIFEDMKLDFKEEASLQKESIRRVRAILEIK